MKRIGEGGTGISIVPSNINITFLIEGRKAESS